MLAARSDLLHTPARSASRRPLLKRGAVKATLDPLEVSWNGERVPLSPLEATLLIALLRRSRLRWEEVAVLLERHGGGADSRDVLIHRVRRKFADIGARDPIETLRGWGLRFRVEADRWGSHALWIGACEDDDIA
jgi:DNA-binding response OmpR family regulator